MSEAELPIGPARPDEWPAVATLCADCIRAAPPAYFAARLHDDPAIRAGGVLVARQGEHLVSTVTLLSLTMGYGAVTIPVGGVANVATDPSHRGRGLARRLVAAGHAEFARRGAPLTALFTTIPAFYAPLGYHPWPRAMTTLLGLRPPSEPTSPAVRPLDLEHDAPALHAPHGRYAARFLGALVRPLPTWGAQRRWTTLYPGEHQSLGLLAANRAGIRGMADAESGWARVLDFGATPDAGEAVATLAAAFVGAACALGARGIRLPASCRELTAAFRPHAAAEAPEEDRTLLLRIGDLAGLLRAIAPELEARAAAAGTGDGEVGIACEDQAAGIQLRAGRLAVGPASPDLPTAALPPAQWIEVLMGGRRVSELPFATASSLGESQLNLLDALFPRRASLFWDADLF